MSSLGDRPILFPGKTQSVGIQNPHSSWHAHREEPCRPSSSGVALQLELLALWVPESGSDSSVPIVMFRPDKASSAAHIDWDCWLESAIPQKNIFFIKLFWAWAGPTEVPNWLATFHAFKFPSITLYLSVRKTCHAVPTFSFIYTLTANICCIWSSLVSAPEGWGVHDRRRVAAVLLEWIKHPKDFTRSLCYGWSIKKDLGR